MHFKDQNEDKPREFAKWEIIQAAYEKDTTGDGRFRQLPKITEEHVCPGKIPKMRVKNATQVTSQSVAAYIHNNPQLGGMLNYFCSKFINM